MIEKDVLANLTKVRNIIRSRDSKVLSITHANCMDGAGSQIIVGNCLNNVTFEKVSYYDINRRLSEIDYDYWDCVLITDISPDSNLEVIDHDNVIVIDHHETALKYHNPEELRFIYEGESGTTLTKKFFETAFKFDLAYLEDLTNVINDYDMWLKEDPRSELLKILYYEHGDPTFRRRFFEGQIKFDEVDKKLFRSKEEKFNRLYQDLEILELNKINACLISTSDFLNELAHKLLTEDKYDIVLVRNPKSKNISLRSNCEELNLGKVLEKLKIGGGHSAAAGMHTTDPIDMKTKIDTFENFVYENFLGLRKKK